MFYESFTTIAKQGWAGNFRENLWKREIFDESFTTMAKRGWSRHLDWIVLLGK